MKLVISPSAARDLQSISDYTLRTWGPEQEERYLKGLWDRLTAIQVEPGAFRVRDDLARGCRSARFEKHVIFFSFTDDALQVIRILHGTMDFVRHLPGDDPSV
ncbi:MAG: type II toxin-antitoxin system RelE/ParE family toxin [Planctomycetaceae bacterium]|nr:type II toxin-antitoxin system RelE/ParE family toxin [Planctomycetaceae bacterium]MCB1123205.1 type II toxin-antitoxin system RelE/ParE family toxin [Verrucomicrobiae bacterium]